MDFLHTFPNTNLRFHTGEMQQYIELDAAYLVIPGASSQAAMHFYLLANSAPNKTYKSRFNAPIHTECQTVKIVVSPVANAVRHYFTTVQWLWACDKHSKDLAIPNSK